MSEADRRGKRVESKENRGRVQRRPPRRAVDEEPAIDHRSRASRDVRSKLRCVPPRGPERALGLPPPPPPPLSPSSRSKIERDPRPAHRPGPLARKTRRSFRGRFSDALSVLRGSSRSARCPDLPREDEGDSRGREGTREARQSRD